MRLDLFPGLFLSRFIISNVDCDLKLRRVYDCGIFDIVYLILVSSFKLSELIFWFVSHLRLSRNIDFVVVVTRPNNFLVSVGGLNNSSSSYCNLVRNMPFFLSMMHRTRHCYLESTFLWSSFMYVLFMM